MVGRSGERLRVMNESERKALWEKMLQLRHEREKERAEQERQQREAAEELARQKAAKLREAQARAVQEQLAK